jgi:hypothetical protein
MTGTPVRVFGPAQLTNAAATKYTVPATLAFDMSYVHFSNPTGSTATKFTFSIGADAAGTRIFDVFPLAAGSVYDWYPNLITLAAAEIIQAFADVTASIVMTINGYLRVV